MMRILTLTTVAATMACAGVRAQTVKAIIVADSTDGSIGPGIVRNEVRVNGLLDRIEFEGGLKVERVVVDGNSFGCKAIGAAVEELQAQSGDTILFFYSGHGFRRTAAQSKFPEFDCRRTPSDAQPVDMSNVVARLNAKHARLVVAIADTCNVSIDVPVPSAAAGTIADPEKRKAAFRRLFAGYSGTLVMSGAIPGEESWYMTTGGSTGGFFTTQLLTAMNERISSQGDAIRWEDVAADATKPIYIPLEKPRYQTPQSDSSRLSRGP